MHYCVINSSCYGVYHIPRTYLLYTGRLYFLTLFTQKSLFCIWSAVCFVLFIDFMHKWEHIIFVFLGLKWVFSFQISIKNLLWVFKSQETTYYDPLSVQFSHSVVSDSLDPMNRSTPGLPVHHQLPEFTQTHVHRVSDSIQPSHPLSSLFLLPPIPLSTRVFSNESTLRMRWLKYGVSASASFLPKKSQGWSPSEWTGWISMQSKRLSRVFSNTTVQKHQFFCAQLSSQSNSHIHT